MTGSEIVQVPTTTMHTTRIVSRTTRTDNTVEIAIWNNVGSVISSAAWPLAVAAIAYVLKADLAALLGRIKSLKALGIEASLDLQIQETLPPVPLNEIGPELQLDESTRAGVLPPAQAILKSWLIVEKALDLAVPPAASVSSSISTRSKVNALAVDARTPTGLPQRVLELYNIRNRLAHNMSEIASEDSIRLYRENALRAARELKELSS